MNPANNFLPVEFQQMAVQINGLLFFPLFSVFAVSGFKSDNDLSVSLIKSQTLTPFSVAADTHYNFGLKHI